MRERVRSPPTLHMNHDLNVLMIVYVYIPTGKDLCDQTNVMCNSDAYGTSLARGSFSYQTGQWQTIWLLVVLNEVGTNNGIVEYAHRLIMISESKADDKVILQWCLSSKFHQPRTSIFRYPIINRWIILFHLLWR